MDVDEHSFVLQTTRIGHFTQRVTEHATFALSRDRGIGHQCVCVVRRGERIHFRGIGWISEVQFTYMHLQSDAKSDNDLAYKSLHKCFVKYACTQMVHIFILHDIIVLCLAIQLIFRAEI